MGRSAVWTFLTNHAHVLLCLASRGDMTIREIASSVGITERAVQHVMSDLESSGYLERTKDGRRNRYTVNGRMLLRHPMEAHTMVEELIGLIARNEYLEEGSMQAIVKTEIKELKKLFSGKVRDIYEVSPDRWLIVTTDRISAFDVVFGEGIPQKGVYLNRVANHWFKAIGGIKNHIISYTPEVELPFLKNYPGIAERSILVRKLNRLPVECVVRGYLFGSVWDEYKTHGTAGGQRLPAGIALAGKLPEPIFTPSSKAEEGHDENITMEQFFAVTGKDVGEKIRDASIRIYLDARSRMEKLGILLADTKFEFGLDESGELYLVDEVLTPDSSRYWVGETYEVGKSPESYDKQFVRDYLLDIKWNKQPPAPVLPAQIIEKTRAKYEQIADIVERV